MRWYFRVLGEHSQGCPMVDRWHQIQWWTMTQDTRCLYLLICILDNLHFKMMRWFQCPQQISELNYNPVHNSSVRAIVSETYIFDFFLFKSLTRAFRHCAQIPANVWVRCVAPQTVWIFIRVSEKKNCTIKYRPICIRF